MARLPDETGEIGHPVGGLHGDTGDPGCVLHYRMWFPNTPAPWPMIVTDQSGGFSVGRGTEAEFQAMDDLSLEGFCGVYFEVRTMKAPHLDGSPETVLPGQTTDGRYSQQTNDARQAIRFARNEPRCNGFVAGYGGSGGGHNLIYWACNGTVGDDKLDAMIAVSVPTNFGDASSRTSNGFRIQSCDYARFDPDDNDPATLAALTALSPIGFLATIKPCPLFHYNGGVEQMPVGQFDSFQAEIIARGYEDIYTPNFVPASGVHSFAAWVRDDITMVKTLATPWINDRYDEWVAGGGGGGGGPPPPPAVREKITVSITGLDPGVALEFHASAKSKTSGLKGPEQVYDFVSDKDVGGGGDQKPPPEGNYVLVPAPGGIPPDLTGKPYLDFAYFDGLRLATQMNVVNPAFKQFNWQVVSDFLGLCALHNKQGAISIAGGIYSPTWVYQRGVQGFNLSGGGVMPVPWDATYISLVKNMIKSFATLFDTSLNLGYVVLGAIGQQNVGTFVVAEEDYNALNALAVTAGFLDVADGWIFTAQQLINYWVKACKGSRCFLQLDYPVPPARGGLAVAQQIVDFCTGAFGNRFGFTSAKLTGATDGSEGLDAILAEEAAQIQCGYQFAYPSSNPLCDPTQDPDAYVAEQGFRNAATAGIALDVAFEEYHETDALTLTDDYPADFATFQTSLKGNSHA